MGPSMGPPLTRHETSLSLLGWSWWVVTASGLQSEECGLVEMVLWILYSQGQFSHEVSHLGSLNVFS